MEQFFFSEFLETVREIERTRHPIQRFDCFDISFGYLVWSLSHPSKRRRRQGSGEAMRHD